MEIPLAFDIEEDELEIFLQDVNEHLQVMEAGILHLERSPEFVEGQSPELTEGQVTALDTLSAVFRAAHTIKAVAATVGHHQMAELTYTLKPLFDAMCEDRLSPTQTVTDELLVTVGDRRGPHRHGR